MILFSENYKCRFSVPSYRCVRIVFLRTSNWCVCMFEGKNMNEEATVVVQDGLDECVKWRESDFQALLMLEGAELEANRGRTDDSLLKLQVQTHTSSILCLVYATIKTQREWKAHLSRYCIYIWVHNAFWTFICWDNFSLAFLWGRFY